MIVVALIVVAAAVLAALVIAVRRPEPVLLDHDEPQPHDALFVPAAAEERVPVEHEGAVEGWSPAADVQEIPVGDPFTRELTDIELDGAPLFAEVWRGHRAEFALDWTPPTFTAEWSRLGTELARMGETQPIPRIEVAA